jgi:hypothetical protein
MKNHHVQPTKLMLRLLIPVFIAACGAFPVQAQQEVNGASALPTSQAVVNFTELARQQRLTGGMTSPQKRSTSTPKENP